MIIYRRLWDRISAIGRAYRRAATQHTVMRRIVRFHVHTDRVKYLVNHTGRNAMWQRSLHTQSLCASSPLRASPSGSVKRAKAPRHVRNAHHTWPVFFQSLFFHPSVVSISAEVARMRVARCGCVTFATRCDSRGAEWKTEFRAHWQLAFLKHIFTYYHSFTIFFHLKNFFRINIYFEYFI